MNEDRGKQSLFSATIILVVIFIIITLFVFKFGKNKGVVYNQQVDTSTNLSREEIIQQIKNEQKGDLWNKYIDKIFSENKISGEQLSQEYKNELEQKTILPEQQILLEGKIVGNTFAERSKYLNEFEKLFISATKKGVFTEAKLFASQAAPDGVVLELSDYDKETILRLATEYELWAYEVLKLDTPQQYENKSLAMGRDLLQIAYILRQLVYEADSQVYVLWIGKYTEKVFDILANRYVK